jgi:hypothetical protein
MKPSICYTILNHVVMIKNNNAIIISLGLFKNKYGYSPTLKTFGSKFRDIKYLTLIKKIFK